MDNNNIIKNEGGRARMKSEHIRLFQINEWLDLKFLVTELFDAVMWIKPTN